MIDRNYPPNQMAAKEDSLLFTREKQSKTITKQQLLQQTCKANITPFYKQYPNLQ